ncbi:MAG: hypothetical protein ABIT38_00010, partial [Gemmatimonadaceae bacterium]
MPVHFFSGEQQRDNCARAPTPDFEGARRTYQRVVHFARSDAAHLPGSTVPRRRSSFYPHFMSSNVSSAKSLRRNLSLRDLVVFGL